MEGRGEGRGREGREGGRGVLPQLCPPPKYFTLEPPLALDVEEIDETGGLSFVDDNESEGGLCLQVFPETQREYWQSD